MGCGNSSEKQVAPTEQKASSGGQFTLEEGSPIVVPELFSDKKLHLANVLYPAWKPLLSYDLEPAAEQALKGNNDKVQNEFNTTGTVYSGTQLRPLLFTRRIWRAVEHLVITPKGHFYSSQTMPSPPEEQPKGVSMIVGKGTVASIKEDISEQNNCVSWVLTLKGTFYLSTNLDTNPMDNVKALDSLVGKGKEVTALLHDTTREFTMLLPSVSSADGASFQDKVKSLVQNIVNMSLEPDEIAGAGSFLNATKEPSFPVPVGGRKERQRGAHFYAPEEEDEEE